MLSHQPAISGEVGKELMTQPGLALSRRTDKEEVVAVACCGADLLDEGGDRCRARDGDAMVDRVGAGDGAEVAAKLGAAQEFRTVGRRRALPGGARGTDEGFSDIDGCTVCVRVHAGADFGPCAVD